MHDADDGPLLGDVWRTIDDAVREALLQYAITLRDRGEPPEARRRLLGRYELDLLQWRVDVTVRIWTIVQTADWPATAPAAAGPPS